MSAALSAIESEREVLGVCLITGSIAEVDGVVHADDFHDPGHAAIYAAMTELDRASKPIDALTVADAMQAADKAKLLNARGGVDAYMTELQTGVVAVSTVAHHAQKVATKADRRRWVLAMKAVSEAGLGGVADADFFADAERVVLELTAKRREQKSATPMKPVMRELNRTLASRYENRGMGGVTGIPGGFVEIDHMTAGYQDGDLVIVAARPSMGKTAYALNTVANASAHAHCLVFSLEMSTQALAERLVASESGVNSSELRTGHISQQSWIRLPKAMARLVERPIWIDDTGALTVWELRSRARRWRLGPAKDAKRALVVVDYLQLLRGGERKGQQNREREIAEISQGLKALAKELGCPVIALSQLNRGVEAREDKRPRMSDLRESGAIEQDADLIKFLFREAVYNDKADPGIAEVIIAKQRNGATGIVKLAWIPEQTRFANLEMHRSA